MSWFCVAPRAAHGGTATCREPCVCAHFCTSIVPHSTRLPEEKGTTHRRPQQARSRRSTAHRRRAASRRAVLVTAEQSSRGAVERLVTPPIWTLRAHYNAIRRTSGTEPRELVLILGGLARVASAVNACVPPTTGQHQACHERSPRHFQSAAIWACERSNGGWRTGVAGAACCLRLWLDSATASPRLSSAPFPALEE